MKSPVQVGRTWLQNTKNPFRGRPQRTNLIILQHLIHNTALWKYLWKGFQNDTDERWPRHLGRREATFAVNWAAHLSAWTLTCRVRGNPAALSSPREKGPVWLAGDCCAGLPCRRTNLHNGECICSKDSQGDLEQNSRLFTNRPCLNSIVMWTQKWSHPKQRKPL